MKTIRVDKVKIESYTVVMYSIEQAAAKVGMTPARLFELCHSGEFHCALAWGGGIFNFSEDDIKRLRVIAAKDKKAQRRAEKKQESMHVEGQDYTVAELAKDWNLSTDTRAMFKDEPGVVEMPQKPNPKRKSIRRYTTLRIPEALAQRVQKRTSYV